MDSFLTGAFVLINYKELSYSTTAKVIEEITGETVSIDELERFNNRIKASPVLYGCHFLSNVQSNLQLRIETIIKISKSCIQFTSQQDHCIFCSKFLTESKFFFDS